VFVPERGHRPWFVVMAGSAEEALRHLPGYVRARTQAIDVAEVTIPLPRRRRHRPMSFRLGDVNTSADG
jgi:hypothetical protein